MNRIIIKESLEPGNNDSVFARFNKFIFRTVSFVLAIPDIFFYGLLFVSLIIIEYYNFHLSTDTSIQLQTLKNFVAGHGITLTSVNENNQVVYLPCSLWPAGFVVFLTPIYLVTKGTIMSVAVLKQITNLFFLLFLSKYFDYLKLDGHKRKFIILFFIVSVMPFVEFGVTDSVATVMCLWAFYFFLNYLESERNKQLFLSMLLLGLCYFVKYSFLPFLFFPAAAFILKEGAAIFKKIKQLVLIIFVTLITALLFYFLNKSLVGTIQVQSSLDALNGHPHWNQLTHFDGFLFTFGIFEWIFENLFKGKTGIQLQFNWLSILVTVYFYLLFVKVFFGRKRTALNPFFKNSINVSLSAGALIIFFLVFLTLNNPGQTWLKPYWTFVQETRYYGPVIIIGLINVLILFLTLKKGTLLHIIVLSMFVLNLFAYRAVLQNGFWGKNYEDYANMKSKLDQELDKKNNWNQPVVFFEKDTKNSDPYYYLQSQGIILLDKSNHQTENIQNGNFDYYELKKDSTKTTQLLKVQN